MRDQILPFKRGTSWSDGGAVTPGTALDELAGKVYEVRDSEHSTGRTVKLRVVKNGTGAAITVPSAPVCYAFDTGAADYGREASAVVATAGAVGKPLDDAYPANYSIPANDLFYVVEEGPCTVATGSGVVGIAAQGAVRIGADGKVDVVTAPAAGNFVLGRVDAAPTADSSVLVHVAAGVAQSA